MPWMFNEPTTAIKEFYAQIGYEKGLDEFIRRERFGNLKSRYDKKRRPKYHRHFLLNGRILKY